MKNKITPNHSLPVLLYHRIVNKHSAIGKHKIYVYENDLEKQLRYLKENNYQTITFYDLQKNPEMDVTKKVILTFDDGYEDNYLLLFPLLKKYSFTAVIYLVTQQTHNYWGVREGEPKVEMMDAKQINEMNEYGIEFGGHTRNHIDLSRCTEEECRNEIAGCKQDVENIIHKNAISFAYPFGGINQTAKIISRESGFEYALATNTGPAQFGEDNFQIRRTEVTSKTTLRSFRNKVSGNYFNTSFLKSLLK